MPKKYHDRYQEGRLVSNRKFEPVGSFPELYIDDSERKQLQDSRDRRRNGGPKVGGLTRGLAAILAKLGLDNPLASEPMEMESMLQKYGEPRDLLKSPVKERYMRLRMRKRAGGGPIGSGGSTPFSVDDIRKLTNRIRGRSRGGMIGLQRGGIIGLQAGGWGGGQQQVGMGVGTGVGGWQGGQPQQGAPAGGVGGGGWGAGGGGMGLKPLGQASQTPVGGGGVGVGGGAQQLASGPLYEPGGMGGAPIGGQPVVGGGAQYQAPPLAPPGYQAQALPQNYGAPASYGGYGGPAQMDVRQEFVAPEVAQQYADLTQGIMETGTRPYEQYQGPRLMGFTGMEAAAQAGMGAYGTGAGPQGTLQAASTLSEAAQGIGGLAPQQQDVATKFGAYAPLAQEQAQTAATGMGTTGTTAATTGTTAATGLRDIGTKLAAPGMMTDVDPATGESVLDPYASQYTQGVIDPQIRAIRAEALRQRSEMGSQAAGAGAFGGYRHGLGEQAAGQAASQQIADVTAKGYEQAFQRAQEGFQADRAAQQAGLGQQLTAEQQAGQVGLEGLRQQQTAQQAAGTMQQQGFGTMGDLYRGQQGALGAEAGLYGQLADVGRQQASLGGQQQQQQYERLMKMQQAGATQRQLGQAGYDIGFEEFQKQKQHPERQISWMGQQLGALPYQNIVQAGSYAPQAGPVTTALSAGLAGQGLWNQWLAGQKPPPGDQGLSTLQRMAMNQPIPKRRMEQPPVRVSTTPPLRRSGR